LEQLTEQRRPHVLLMPLSGRERARCRLQRRGARRRPRLALTGRRARAQGDPFKTLFVGRLSFEATEKKLRREFEEYGPIKRIRLVTEKESGAEPYLNPAVSHPTCKPASAVPQQAPCDTAAGLARLVLRLYRRL